MNTEVAIQARSDREAYANAMMRGHVNICYAIEGRYDLLGYPPEIVCIGLSAAAEGRDVDSSIAAYMAGES